MPLLCIEPGAGAGRDWPSGRGRRMGLARVWHPGLRGRSSGFDSRAFLSFLGLTHDHWLDLVVRAVSLPCRSFAPLLSSACPLARRATVEVAASFCPPTAVATAPSFHANRSFALCQRRTRIATTKTTVVNVRPGLLSTHNGHVAPCLAPRRSLFASVAEILPPRGLSRMTAGPSCILSLR
jgi:hypothetical protein